MNEDTRDRLFQRLRRLFGWKPDDTPDTPDGLTHAQDYFNPPPRRMGPPRLKCPKCGAQDYSMRLTSWITGPGLENDGETLFVKVCNRCGTEWADGCP